MDHSELLNSLSQELLDLKIRLRTIAAQIQGIDRDISVLEMVRSNFTENIFWMKKKNIIASATEFKKVKNDLHTANVRLAFLLTDKEGCLKIRKYVESLYEETKLKYEYEIEKLNNPLINVIKIDFRSKNGKK